MLLLCSKAPVPDLATFCNNLIDEEWPYHRGIQIWVAGNPQDLTCSPK